MGLSPFNVGDVVTLNQISDAFGVSPYSGGMLKSNKNKCLVLISYHYDLKNRLYEDKWYGEELHYTGMGQEGDQLLNWKQNKTLYDSNTNGIEVHLFEVIEKGEYTYRGIVKLTGEPYQEIQPDKNKVPRKVWMFPITPITGAPEYTKEKLDEVHVKLQTQAERMTLSELEAIAKARSSKEPSIKVVKAKQRDRDEFVAVYTKKRAKGVCQLCNQPAPFRDKQGNPYLESHHIVWLSNGGEDTIENSVALCPNCHKKMHVVNDPNDVKKLKTLNSKL